MFLGVNDKQMSLIWVWKNASFEALFTNFDTIGTTEISPCTALNSGMPVRTYA